MQTLKNIHSSASFICHKLFTLGNFKSEHAAAATLFQWLYELKEWMEKLLLFFLLNATDIFSTMGDFFLEKIPTRTEFGKSTMQNVAYPKQIYENERTKTSKASSLRQKLAWDAISSIMNEYKNNMRHVSTSLF